MATFNPIDYLYYNPELQAYSNVITIEDAQIYYNTSNNAQSLVPNTSNIPNKFDPYLLITTNKDNIHVSALSHTISMAMSNDGLTNPEIQSKGRFLTTIFQDVNYMSSNVFQLTTYPSYTFNSSNIRVGDEIKINDEVKREFYLSIASYTPSNITVSSHKYELYTTSNYMLDGIKVIDPLRLGKISLTRNYVSFTSNQNIVIPESGVFNPTLYRILYPDAASLTDQQAYIDYIAKRKNNVLRVNNADELIVNYTATSNVKITGINNTINRSIPDFGESNRLVTEYGIRQYTETIIDEIKNIGDFSTVAITSNLIVSGPTTLDGDLDVSGSVKVSNTSILTGGVTMSNFLRVMKEVTFDSNVSINNNALVYGTLSVHGNMYNPRIGIGYFMDSNGDNNNGSNNANALISSVGSNTYIIGTYVGVGTSSPTEKLDVSGNLKVSNNVYIMNNLGLGTTNPTYQLQLSTDSAAKPSTTTWTTTSDVRLKTNITIADKTRCYDIIKNLPLKHYTWSKDYVDTTLVTDNSKLGWIAQDVQEVFPKAVRTTSMYGLQDCKTLDADQIYATMYGAIQKLQDIVEQLQQDNISLKRQLNNINSK
jgi:Chaperone of endosialidase